MTKRACKEDQSSPFRASFRPISRPKITPPSARSGAGAQFHAPQYDLELRPTWRADRLREKLRCGASISIHPVHHSVKAPGCKGACQVWRPKHPIVFGEIFRILTHRQHSFAGRALGMDHIMGFKLDVEEFQFVEFVRRVKGNRRPIDQTADRHECAVDKDRMSLRQEQITVRHIGRESRTDELLTGKTSFTQVFRISLL